MYFSFSPQGDVQAATDRMEQMSLHAISSLAALTFVPQEVTAHKEGKQKIAEFIADRILKLSDGVGYELLILLRHPMHCCAVLKVDSLVSYCSFSNVFSTYFVYLCYNFNRPLYIHGRV